jgi:hypothetical protein
MCRRSTVLRRTVLAAILPLIESLSQRKANGFLRTYTPFYSSYCFVFVTESLAMDGRWDPIIACGMIDPQDVATCLGHTKANNRCKNPISKKSREDASHLVQLLAQRPAGDDLLPTLGKIARLLLCKRYHQRDEEKQVNPLAKLWYDAACPPGMGRRQQLAPNFDSRRIGSRSNPVDLTATPLTPIEIERSAPQAQPVSVETLRRKQVPFEVSPDSPARVMFETWDGNDTSVILRSLSQGQSNSDRECSICHGTSAEDTVYLKCEQCRTDIHLQCMESWLEARSTSINFDCPIW